MNIDIEQQKRDFLALCRREIRREGIESLLEWLQAGDFFTAPGSRHYHGAYAGGLCQHSMDVYAYAKRAAALCDSPIDPESLAIASLFHDICKVGYYKVEMRRQKIGGEWKESPYYSIDEMLAFGGHGSKSVYLVQRFMPLTEDEAVAINCHMGFSDTDEAHRRNISAAYAKCPLAWIVHVADEAACYLLDRCPASN